MATLTDRPRRSICGRSRGGPPVLLRRLLAIVLVSVSVVGCNAILGNDDHDYSPDLDATVDGAPGEHAPDASVDAGLREAASGSDAREAKMMEEARVSMVRLRRISSPGPGSDGGEVTARSRNDRGHGRARPTEARARVQAGDRLPRRRTDVRRRRRNVRRDDGTCRRHGVRHGRGAFLLEGRVRSVRRGR